MLLATSFEGRSSIQTIFLDAHVSINIPMTLRIVTQPVRWQDEDMIREITSRHAFPCARTTSRVVMKEQMKLLRHMLDAENRPLSHHPYLMVEVCSLRHLLLSNSIVFLLSSLHIPLSTHIIIFLLPFLTFIRRMLLETCCFLVKLYPFHCSTYLKLLLFQV